MTRIRTIDGLRGLAALVVVVVIGHVLGAAYRYGQNPAVHAIAKFLVVDFLD